MAKSILPSVTSSTCWVAAPVAEICTSAPGTYLFTALAQAVLTMNGVVPGGKLPSL